MNPWESFIRQAGTTIAQRGLAYFMDGLVDDLEEIESGFWTASVHGSDLYFVTVETTGDEVTDWLCDCPYDGAICKHVVAVVYGIQEQNQLPYAEEPASEVSSAPGKPPKKKAGKSGGSRVDQIFARVSDADLRDFVSNVIKTEPGLKNLFLARFAGLLEEDPEKKYRTIITSTLKSATNRYGFIDYQSTHKVDRIVTSLFTTAGELYGQSNTEEAAAICRVIIEEISGIMDSADDSGGALGGYLLEAISELHTIADMAPDDLRSQLFTWCMGELSTSRYRYTGIEHDFIILLPDLVTGPHQEQAFFEYIDNGLKLARTTRRENTMWFGHSDERSLLAALMDYHERTGRNEEHIRILESNIHIPEFRMQLIEKAIDDREYDKAKKLCLDPVAMKGPGGYHQHNPYRETLLQIAKLTGDTGDIRKWSLDLFLYGWNNDAVYADYKSTWPAEQWNSACEDLITMIRDNTWKSVDGRSVSEPASKLAHIYIKEGYWQRLLLLARQNITDLRLFDNLKPLLIPHYPEEVMEMLATVIEMLSTQTGRENYRDIAARLRELSQLPDGDERTYELMKELLSTYRNRPAMKEEFKKAFPKWVE